MYMWACVYTGAILERQMVVTANVMGELKVFLNHLFAHFTVKFSTRYVVVHLPKKANPRFPE
jgi:hypothetical protein